MESVASVSVWPWLAPLLCAGALAVFLGWMVGRRNPVTGQPLGLPEGSVRAMIALLIIGGIMALVAFDRQIPPELWAAFGVVLGSYFTARNQASANNSSRQAGFARPLLLLPVGLALLFLPACTSILRPVQAGVDRAAKTFGGQKAVDGVHSFRAAEGQIYADDNGLISTSGMQHVVSVYAIDEGRWITGRVRVAHSLIYHDAPLGPAPAPAATPVPPSVVNPSAGLLPAPLPSDGGGTTAPLAGPTTGGVQL